jgi:hypothetical protein
VPYNDIIEFPEIHGQTMRKDHSTENVSPILFAQVVQARFKAALAILKSCFGRSLRNLHIAKCIDLLKYQRFRRRCLINE